MADKQDTGTEDRAPLLTETAASQTVPILTDAVAEPAPVTPAEATLSDDTVEALREALTGLARELARECLAEILDEARQTLDHRLEGRFEERLGPLIEQALREHLTPRD